MEKHIMLAGILNIVYRAFALLGAGVLLILAAWFGPFFESLMHKGFVRPHEVPVEILDIIPMILLIAGIGVLVFSLASIIGSIGVLKKREWGRILLLVISFFTLVKIPLGTILGIYTIWVLLNDETIRLFKAASSPAATTQQDDRRMA